MNLSKIGALTVISRTSAMQYKETDKSLPQIAQELGVEAIVEGSVQLVGEEVREITVNAPILDRFMIRASVMASPRRASEEITTEST